MPTQIIWKIAIIVQQDGEHNFEYADLELAILSQPRFKNIKYKIFYYDQVSKTRSVRKVSKDSSGAPVIITELQPSPVDLYDPGTLTGFLKDWFTPEGGLTERYMVIIWAHGAGLGYAASEVTEDAVPNYFRDLDAEAFGPKRQTMRHSYNDAMRQLTFLKSHQSWNSQPIEHLKKRLYNDGVELAVDDLKMLAERLKLITAADLNTIFTNSLPAGKKVEVLITNTCYTQMLETGYALRSKVDLLVSPETTIPFTGFNYNALFRLMVQHPQLEQKEIAENIRDSFADKYESEPFRTNFRIMRPFAASLLGEVSFSANDLNKYDLFIKNFFSDLAERFLRTLDEDSRDELLWITIRKAREQCLDVAPLTELGQRQYWIIDLTHFIRVLSKLCQRQNIPGWDEMLQNLEKQTDSIRIAWYKAKGASVYSMNRPSISPYFLSVFFPGRKDSDLTDALLNIYKTDSTDTEFPLKSTTSPDFVIKWSEGFTIFDR